MTFLDLTVDFLIALLLGAMIGSLWLVLRSPLPANRRLRALRRRLLGRAWRPVLLIPVTPMKQPEGLAASNEETKPSASSR